MNLISGKILSSEQSKKQLECLDEIIKRAYSGEELTDQKVISACDAFSQSLNDKEHLPLLLSIGMSHEKAQEELALVKQMLSREYLEERLRIELGDETNKSFTPVVSTTRVRQEYKPLGVLFHIAAGNVDALPVFSVIEGLLTGNINILKLPGSGDRISITVLQELIKLEPLIADYVMVFDYPSQDVDAMKKMAEVSDAIVVWGSDDAVSAVRKMAKPDTRIIEWGHKISFAYVSGNDISDEELKGIAYNICDTNQVFCNSCQGIYLDTENHDELVGFAQRFIAILDKMAQTIPLNYDPYFEAQKTLELYTEELESNKEKKQVLRRDNCSVIVEYNSTLKPSYMFRNCWIKPLPKNKILSELVKYKNHLQTVALVCEKNDRVQIESLLYKTGVVRITNGKNMSKNYCGIPHDGEFPLRRYMKIVSYEY